MQPLIYALQIVKVCLFDISAIKSCHIHRQEFAFLSFSLLDIITLYLLA